MSTASKKQGTRVFKKGSPNGKITGAYLSFVNSVLVDNSRKILSRVF